MKRSTVYLEDDLHKALKIKAADTEIPMSSLVNEAVRQSLIEDAEDLQAFNDRADESSVDFESFVQQLKKNGKLQVADQKVHDQGN
jgi:plasmid stability protein